MEDDRRPMEETEDSVGIMESFKKNAGEWTRRWEIRQKKRRRRIRSRLLRQAMVAEGLFSAGHKEKKKTH